MQTLLRMAMTAAGMAVIGAAYVAGRRRIVTPPDQDDFWADVIRRAQPSLHRAYEIQQFLSAAR